MELYTVDPTNSNRREALIEHYESFIWTDRYSAAGDFQIVAEPTLANILRLVPDKLVGFDLSDRVMIIRSALIEEDDNKKRTLKIVGESLEAQLKDRLARSSLGAANWAVTGTIGAICTYFVKYVCVDGTAISASDVIPNLTVLNSDTTSVSRTISAKTAPLYDVIKALVDSEAFGFRIKVTPGTAAMPFEVYKGTDRSGKDGVSFSGDLESLSKTSYLNTKADYKNVAYVVAPNGQRIVYATGASTVSGLARRVLFVDASDVTTAAGATLNDQLDRRGQTALSEHLATKIFDGTINPNGTKKFNTHYFMGDIVDIVGDDGTHQPMRVTEYIWSADNNGLVSYPTLTSVGGV